MIDWMGPMLSENKVSDWITEGNGFSEPQGRDCTYGATFPPRYYLFQICRPQCSFFFLFFLIVIFYLFIYYIYFWLCWVFVSVRGLSLVVASGGHSSSRCAGLFTIAASLVAEHGLQTRRLSSCGLRA